MILVGSLAPRMVTVSLAVCSANPESSEYHRSHHQTTVHAYYVLDVYSNQVCFKVTKRGRERERGEEEKEEKKAWGQDRSVIRVLD